MTLLERRGRLPQHTYLDYSITSLSAAVIIALTFSQIGGRTPDGPNFILSLSDGEYLVEKEEDVSSTHQLAFLIHCPLFELLCHFLVLRVNVKLIARHEIKIREAFEVTESR